MIKPVSVASGAVRVSFGAASSVEDCDEFALFLQQRYLNRPEPSKAGPDEPLQSRISSERRPSPPSGDGIDARVAAGAEGGGAGGAGAYVYRLFVYPIKSCGGELTCTITCFSFVTCCSVASSYGSICFSNTCH